MDYIYAVLLLHNAKKDITEKNIKKVLKSIGVKPDDAKVKGLVTNLKDVDIEEAVKKASMPVASAPAESKEDKKEEKEEEEEEEEAVSEESAAEGLGALFG